MSSTAPAYQQLPSSLSLTGRVHYRVRRGAACFHVIADCHADGSWAFSESEGDEPRWHAFQPAAAELDYARRILRGSRPSPETLPRAPWFQQA